MWFYKPFQAPIEKNEKKPKKTKKSQNTITVEDDKLTFYTHA